MSKLPVVIVDAWELRRRFNDGGYLERIEAGEFRMFQDRHPTKPKAPVPICTRSQLIELFDTKGRRVVLAHRYLLPNGQVRGRPDPKTMLEDGVLYQAR